MQRRHWTTLCLVLVTLAVMGPLCGGEFTNWDDNKTVSKNPRLNPPSWESVGHYWAHSYESLYVPVTYTVWNGLAAVARLETPDPNTGVALNSWVFHTANVLVHVVNVLLAFAVLRLLVPGDEWAACLGALLYAVHPVQVEPVGWVSGMKDLLCGTFSLLAIWQYLLYAIAMRDGHEAKPGPGSGSRPARPRVHYAVGVVALLLGILSKPTAMVVPLIVVVLDVWMLGRPLGRVLAATWPWFAVSAPLAALAKYVQPADLIDGAPLWARPFLAGFTLSFYLGKLAAPVQLAFDYGWRPPLLLNRPWFYALWLIPLGVGVIVWRRRRRWPGVWVGALLFVIGILPVLGFTRFLFQAFSTVADHYLYLAMLGPAVALAWGVSCARAPRGRRIALAVAGVALLAFAARAGVQTRVWQDSRSVNANSVAVSDRSYASYNNLGTAYDDMGDALWREGRPREAYQAYRTAADLYRESVRSAPSPAGTSRNLARVLVRIAELEPTAEGQRARFDEAARHAEMMVESPPPTDPSAAPTTRPQKGATRAYVAELYARAGNWPKVVQQYERILREEPSNADVAKLLEAARKKLDADPGRR